MDEDKKSDAVFEIVLCMFSVIMMTMRKFLNIEFNDVNYQLDGFKEKIKLLIVININKSLMALIDSERTCFDPRIPILINMIDHKSPICLFHFIKEIIILLIPDNNPIIEIDSERKKNMSVIEIRNEERHKINDIVNKIKTEDFKICVNNSLTHECHGKTLEELRDEWKKTGIDIRCL